MALVIALLSGPCQKINAPEPFLFCDLHFARKSVQMLNQAAQDFLESRIRCFREALDHSLGDGVLVEVAHAPVSCFLYLSCLTLNALGDLKK